MNLHEYQAKALLQKYGVVTPKSEVISTPEEAISAANQLGGDTFVVKAQVHAGGRGKAGGVKIVKGKDALLEAVKSLLGTRLVTFQTDAHGQPVNQLLIEEPSDIDRELYLGAVVDRATQRIVFMASTEGGMDIEEVAEHTPEKIVKVVVDPTVGMQPFQCRQMFFSLNLDVSLMREFTKIVMGLYQLFVECDLGLIEINPLVLTKDERLICLDGKMNVDERGTRRHRD